MIPVHVSKEQPILVRNIVGLVGSNDMIIPRDPRAACLFNNLYAQSFFCLCRVFLAIISLPCLSLNQAALHKVHIMAWTTYKKKQCGMNYTHIVLLHEYGKDIDSYNSCT